jgi:hypothetical protein
VPLKDISLAQKRHSGFRLQAPVRLASLTPTVAAQKCNEALSRDLWPLDPFESAPMRATSSGMGYCILCAIRFGLETKELAELLGGKMGRNSLTLKKLLGEIFHEAPSPKLRASSPEFITWPQSPASLILETTIQKPFIQVVSAPSLAGSQECQDGRLTAT